MLVNNVRKVGYQMAQSNRVRVCFRVRLRDTSSPGAKHNSYYVSDDSDTVGRSAGLKRYGDSGKRKMESIAQHANKTWNLAPSESFVVVRSSS